MLPHKKIIYETNYMKSSTFCYHWHYIDIVKRYETNIDFTIWLRTNNGMILNTICCIIFHT